MSDQRLIPFKAKFQISVDTSMKEFFKDSSNISLVNLYEPLLKPEGIDIKTFIANYHLRSSVYNDFKEFSFNFNQAFDISPTNLTSSEQDCSLSFKLNSFEIEVLQILDKGKEVTFSDSSKIVKTINLTNNIKLIKV